MFETIGSNFCMFQLCDIITILKMTKNRVHVSLNTCTGTLDDN